MKLKKRKEKIRRVDYSETIVDRNFSRFEADIIGGNVIIKNGPEDQASIRVQWKAYEDTSAFCQFWLEANTVRLQSKSFQTFIGQMHPYIIEVTLPSHIHVAVKMLAGMLYLENLAGDVHVNLKAGDILGTLSSKKIFAKLWTGDIKIILNDVTSQSDIYLKCYMGDVDLECPKGTLVKLDEYHSPAEGVYTRVGANIRVKTFLGDSHIEERE